MFHFRFQWQLQSKNIFYLLWRILIATFFVAAVITSMASLTHDDFQFYFIYLTNWGIILCMITAVYGAILVTYWHFHSSYAGIVNRQYFNFKKNIMIVQCIRIFSNFFFQTKYQNATICRSLSNFTGVFIILQSIYQQS